MPQQDQTGNSEFVLPTGQQVYDALMGEIEPDLLTTSIPLLEEKHKGESDEERSMRYRRYEQAYEQYDQAFAAWSVTLQNAVHDYRREALRSAEEASREKEASALQQLEQAIV